VVAGYLTVMPELPKLPKVGKTEVIAASAADIALILHEPFGKGCGPHRKKARQAARLAIALAAYGGLRASEVRGLTWSDVNLKAKTITIRRAICFGEIDSPKSGNERTIPIAAPLLAMLVEAAKKPRCPWGPVAPKADGEVWADHGLLQALKRACKRLGISGQRYHGLRHYFVSALFEGGASAPTVQELAGHASLDVTQRYAHTTREAKQRAVAVFAFGNSVETTLATLVAGGEKAG
jgi:integrase